MLHALRLVALLLFNCSCQRRGLPSFPTRRSSDLERMKKMPVPMVEPTPTIVSENRPIVRLRSVSTSSFCRGTRSEEHTSELQSRGQLVCRLLLEKKNQRKQNDANRAGTYN